jgi:hypothetical protein
MASGRACKSPRSNLTMAALSNGSASIQPPRAPVELKLEIAVEAPAHETLAWPRPAPRYWRRTGACKFLTVATHRQCVYNVTVAATDGAVPLAVTHAPRRTDGPRPPWGPVSWQAAPPTGRHRQQQSPCQRAGRPPDPRDSEVTGPWPSSCSRAAGRPSASTGRRASQPQRAQSPTLKHPHEPTLDSGRLGSMRMSS